MVGEVFAGMCAGAAVSLVICVIYLLWDSYKRGK